MKRNKGTILSSGVPLNRGTPFHVEHMDDTAYTRFDRRSGLVEEVHTPQDTLRRIHELMHARHSTPEHSLREYAGVLDCIAQVVEDCRIHLCHWPWQQTTTPKDIRDTAREFVDGEVRRAVERSAYLPPQQAAWPCFAIRLRAAAVRIGMKETDNAAYRGVGFIPGRDMRFAHHCIELIRNGYERNAALDIQAAFFEPDDMPPIDGDDEVTVRDGKVTERGGNVPTITTSGAAHTSMTIIELPHTEAIKEATVGFRVATSGSRLYRPALRRPILPQRLFVRRSAIEPQGTILIDASGSMGDWDQVADWVRKAPFAQVAYYAGNGESEGWLYVYARGGFRASEIVRPPYGGNTVDGLALDWLMRQEPPRIMVTDRGFCDAADSEGQKMRLALLESRGEVTVANYKRE